MDTDIKFQFAVWGYVTLGEPPRDPMTRWLENYRNGMTGALFDQTEEYFEVVSVNNERPPWRHALLPAALKAFKEGKTWPPHGQTH